MFGPPLVRPDVIDINVGCPIETGFEFSSAITTDQTVSCEFQTGVTTRSKISKTTTIDSSISTSI